MSGHIVVEVECAECGKSTLARRYLVRQGQERFFCNHSCAGKAGARASAPKRRSVLRTESYRLAQSERMKCYYREYPEKATRLYGKDNPAYKHGEARSRRYIGFTETRKQQVRERDQHTCQLCSRIWNGEKPRFDIHHIDYDKDNFKLVNLVTLCKNCHGKTHYDREHWIRTFTDDWDKCL